MVETQAARKNKTKQTGSQRKRDSRGWTYASFFPQVASQMSSRCRTPVLEALETTVT
jgi:hypothetical protein